MDLRTSNLPFSIRAPGIIPAGRFHSATRIIQHLLRSAPGSGVLAYRLLGKNRRKSCAAHSGNVSGSGDSEAITKTKGGREGKWGKHFRLGLDQLACSGRRSGCVGREGIRPNLVSVVLCNRRAANHYLYLIAHTRGF